MTAPDRQGRARRGLLTVLVVDATAVAALGLVALATRGRPSGPGHAVLAGTATVSLLPAVVAVGIERRTHRPGRADHHRARAVVALLLAGSLLATAGPPLVLGTRTAAGSRGHVATPARALQLGGGAVLVPYLASVRALHRPVRGRAVQEP